VFPAFAEYFDHQVGEAIDDLGVVSEIRGCVDHAMDFYDAFYPVEVSQLSFEGGELLYPNEPGSIVSLFHRQVCTKFTGNSGTIGPGRTFPGQENEVAATDGMDVVGFWYAEYGEFDVEGEEFGNHVFGGSGFRYVGGWFGAGRKG
jgi:hypothetical protein